MEPSGRVHPRHSEDFRRLPQGHHRHECNNTYERKSKAPSDKTHGKVDSGEGSRAKQGKENARDEGLIEKYGAVLLAASLGFGAGVLFSEIREDRIKHDRRYYSDGGRGRASPYENRARLEHHGSNDWLALTGSGARARSASRTGHCLRDDDLEYGHWY